VPKVDTSTFTITGNNNTRLTVLECCDNGIGEDSVHRQLHIGMDHLFITKNGYLSIGADSYDERIKPNQLLIMGKLISGSMTNVLIRPSHRKKTKKKY
jgi:hypothetical protein